MSEKLSRTGMTLNEVRSKIAGLHFSKECLTKEERQVLVLTEAALFFLDEMLDEAKTVKAENDYD